MQWDSAAYLRFKAERTQPSIDLVKRIDLEQPRKLLDVSKLAGLGWRYKTELPEGIRRTYEDFLHNDMRAER